MRTASARWFVFLAVVSLVFAIGGGFVRGQSLLLVATISQAEVDDVKSTWSADVKALPFPPDTSDLQFDAVFEDLEFTSGSSLASLAAFYRLEMTRRNWKEDPEEATEEDDSIEMTFRHGEAEVAIEMDLRSKGIVEVKIDTEELTWEGMNDPAALAAAGLPQPRAYVFLQKNVTLPAAVRELAFEGDGCRFKSDLSHQQLFDHFTGIITTLGFKESRRPIITEDRRYTQFKQGSITLSVNIFADEQGSRAVLGYENSLPEQRGEPLPAVASSNMPAKPGRTTVTETPERPKSDSSTPGKRRVNVANNKGSATVWLGSDKYEFKHVAAYYNSKNECTMLIFADKPIPYQQMQKMVSEEEGDFSFFDLYEFSTPGYLRLQVDEYMSFSFSVDGIGISNSIDNPQHDIKVENGRVRGSLKMEPTDFFDRKMKMELQIDAGWMAPDTVIGDATTDPAPATGSLAIGASKFPVPDGADEVQSGGSRYYKYTKTRVDMPLAEVVAFYRKQLPADDYREDLTRSAVQDATSRLVFQDGNQTVVVSLARSGNQTSIEIESQDAAAAKADGLLPEPGKARLVMGNAHSRDIVVTMGGNDYKVKAGQGAANPREGLNYTVSAGKYTFTIKIPGQSPETETLEIGPDTAWGIIALPNGGYLADRLY